MGQYTMSAAALEVRRRASRIAVLPPGDPERVKLEQELAEAALVRAIVDRAPKLSPAQRAKLAALLSPPPGAAA